MGTNTQFVGLGDEDAWAVQDALRQAKLPRRLGRSSAVNLSHDRGLHKLVGFLRGYAWHVAREGKAPPKNLYKASEARFGRFRVRPRDVYGSPPDHCPDRFPHLIYPHFGVHGCLYMPADFERPFVLEFSSGAGRETWPLYLGSCPRLLEELEELDHWLGVPRSPLQVLEEHEQAGTHWDLESVDDMIPLSDPFSREKEAWLRVHCFASLAARHDLAISAS